MFSLPPHQVEALVEEGHRGARTLKAHKDDPHRLLVTIFVGNNLVNIGLSSIATGLLGLYLTGIQAVTATTFGVTALVLLFGESLPKSYAVENTESWALRISGPLETAEYVLLPLVVTFDFLTRQLSRLTGSDTGIEATYLTRAELQYLIDTGEREGSIEADEREMFRRIFRLEDRIAKEIMTPRLDVTGLAIDTPIGGAVDLALRSEFVRLPVYEDDLDTAVGFVHLRDLTGRYVESEGTGDLDGLARPLLRVPESKDVDDLFEEMRAGRHRMALVVDEFGATAGILTLEDLLEEVVGELLEESEDLPIATADDRSIVVRGQVTIEEVNDALDISLPESEEFETIAGFVLDRAGRIVDKGEIVAFEEGTIAIEEVENTRVVKARVTRYPEDEKEEAERVDESQVA
jgi:CBS domain containing-hemolysin-like protein